MTPNGMKQSSTRWGEAVVLFAALPGLIAATILALGLVSDSMGLSPTLGPLTTVLAFVAMSSPFLVVIGTVSLIGGALAALQVPGRSRYKWGILIMGILAWA